MGTSLLKYTAAMFRIVDKARGIPRSQLLPPIEPETPNRKRRRLGIIFIFIVLFILIICGKYSAAEVIEN